VVYLDDNIAHFDFEAAWPLLSRQRQEQALQFRFEQERKQCAMAYSLLCMVLRE
jgi:4'-phosphopantetheinyl transferase